MESSTRTCFSDLVFFSQRTPSISRLIKIAKKVLKAAIPAEFAPRFHFDLNVWESASRNCPFNRSFMLDGLENGFDIHVPETAELERYTVRNLPTKTVHDLAITDWINEQHSKGALWGPWRKPSEFPAEVHGLRVSPIGVVEKGDHFGKDWRDQEWRVIHHLSHPRNGVSVNSEIDLNSRMWIMFDLNRSLQ